MTMNKYQWLAIYALAAIGLWLFWDYATEIILTILGLGAYKYKQKKAKTDKAQTIADEHESMADARIIQAAHEIQKAETAHDKALEIAESEDDTTPIPVKPGGVRRSFKSQ